MASVQEAQRKALARYSHDLAGALLYLDGGAAEALAAVGAVDGARGAPAPGLLVHARLIPPCAPTQPCADLGAALVCDLAAASPADLATATLLSGGAPVRRVAFLLTSLLRDAEAAVLAACHACSAAAQFTVLCSASEAAHADEGYGPHSYASVAAAWQQQLNERRRAAGGGPCSLAIHHCPLLMCPLSSSAFVLPAAAACVTRPRAGRLAAGFSAQVLADSDDADADEGGPAAAAGAAGAGAHGLSLLAHALVNVTSLLGYRPEAFSLGPCSRRVCAAMGFVPAAAGDAPPAALVLVDRLLDPITPAQHADLLVQRMHCALSGGSSAAAFAPSLAEVPLLPLGPRTPAAAAEGDGSGGDGGTDSAAAGSGSRDAGSMLPGRLRHPDDPQARGVGWGGG